MQPGEASKALTNASSDVRLKIGDETRQSLLSNENDGPGAKNPAKNPANKTAKKTAVHSKEETDMQNRHFMYAHC